MRSIILRLGRSRAALLMAAFGLWLGLGAVAQANDYYVDADWTGPYSGTADQPFQTLSNAVATANGVAAVHNLYIASGTYADIANGGLEDFSEGGGTGGGIANTRKINYYGGYAGWQGGTSFDWTTRIPRATTIDLKDADSRAFYNALVGNPNTGPLFDGLTFKNASHANSGGCLFTSAGQYTTMFINNCYFTNNSVTGSTAHGGAVFLLPTFQTSYIRNSDFVDNSAGGYGGAVWWNPQNSAANVTNCTFVGNQAGGRGGAIFVNQGNASSEIKGCTFADNQSSVQGGAVFNRDFVINIRECDFHGNAAPAGAAIGGNDYWCGAYILRNCLVYGNTGGYAVQAQGNRMSGSYSLDVLHCTIVSNSGGGLIAGDNASTRPMRVRNSIVADNGGYGIYIAADTYTSANNNVYSNTVGNYYNCSADAGSISTNADFIDADADDYRLAIGSPSIDTGTNDTGLAEDLLGTMRPTRNGWDQGCYEELSAIRIQNLVPVSTKTNAVLRGELIYNGLSNAYVTIYWGVTNGGITHDNWGKTNGVGLVSNGASFEANVTDVTPGATYWFRCFASNVYDGVWADESSSFDIPLSGATCLWTGGSSNVLASNPDNWFSGVTPTFEDTIKLDNVDSNMTWDAAAPHQVAEWVQTDQYDGQVTIESGWSNGFSTLMISNDMMIAGGSLTHLDNPADGSALYRLKLEVGGNFTLAVGTSIDVDGKGYYPKMGPGGSQINVRGGSHGGEGYFQTGTPVVYGSVWEPITLGSGGFELDGGGAVYIDVVGTATVSGTVSADSPAGSNNQDGGAGGSIFIRAGVLAGDGALEANGGGHGYDSTGGGGGRIALIVTNATAFGDIQTTAKGDSGVNGRGGAAGTVYRESTAHSAHGGIVVIDNRNVAVRWARTIIPTNHPLEQFSSIIITNDGVLGFAPGEIFDFGAMTNISPEGVGEAYITVRDLTGITIPNPFTIAGYTLRLDTNVSLSADWAVASNGCLSHSWNEGDARFGVDLDLTGNLTIDGSIDVRGGGYAQKTGTGYQGCHGGLSYNRGSGQTYGSITNPSTLGSGAYYVAGGGKVRLSVSGNTAINGSIQADSQPSWNNEAAGGSVCLETATLSGTGTIRAVGGVVSGASLQAKGGGGGRIAVYLTGSDSLGAVTVSAQGGQDGADTSVGDGGPGTVYVQTQGDVPGSGTLWIDNGTLSTNTSARTEIPSVASDDLAAITLVLTNNSIVSLTTNIAVAELSVASGSLLDLNGWQCYVDVKEHPFDGQVVPNGGLLLWYIPPQGMLFLVR